MKEIWKNIKWYKWVYRISNKKRVYSNKWFWMILLWSINVPFKVILYKDWERKEFPVIELYREAFNIKIEEKVELEANTKDTILLRYWQGLEEICKKHWLLLKEEVLTQRRDKYIKQCRFECYCYLRKIWMTYQSIWKAFWKNHAAIMYTIKTYWSKDNK